ncbi:MAG TPA: PPC domain-containing protein [Longimicrobium sp.]|nr:PPC domain-containing protein [Longimicrobium sp.]
MRILSHTILWLMLALSAAAPAAAQRGVPALRLGDSVRLTLPFSDPRLSSGHVYRAFRFQARPEHIYHFAGASDSADVELRVARQAGPLTDYLPQGSRAGGGGVGMRFLPPEPGEYLLVLTSHSGGDFTLFGEEIALVSAPPRPLVLGRGRPAVLTERSSIEVVEGSELHYDLYSFSASRGQVLDVATPGIAGTFGRMEAGRFVAIEAGDTMEYEGRVVVPQDGEYAIRVESPLLENDSLRYAVWVVDPAARPLPRPLQVGQPVEARLNVDSVFPRDGDVVDEWSMYATAGQRLQVTARSTAFDTYLMVGRMRDGRWEQLNYNDDTEGTDSRLVLEVPETGEYLVRVRPFREFPDSLAPYSLLVEPLGAMQVAVVDSAAPRRGRPEMRPVRWGAQMTGRLEAADAPAEDGSPYDAWTFDATAGQRITITLRSTEFDAYLAVGREVEGEWMELSSNDDIAAESTTDARVVMIAPDTGHYTIRVNTFPQAPAGEYTLTVERSR